MGRGGSAKSTNFHLRRSQVTKETEIWFVCFLFAPLKVSKVK
jgi:hypothetical protein